MRRAIIAARLEPTDETGESGFTLIEVLASMTIMSIFLAMFTAALIQLFGASNKANAVTDSSAQISLAFLRLDREIRYAAAIDQPSQHAGNWYVEYSSQNTGTSMCSQLRLANGVLSERSWAPAPAAPSAWSALASGFDDTGSSPFTFYPTDNSHAVQRLQLNLQATAGSGSSQTTSSTNVSFAALNSSSTTKTNEPTTPYICQEHGSP